MPFSLCHRKKHFPLGMTYHTCQDPDFQLIWLKVLGNRKRENRGQDKNGSRVLPMQTSLYFCLFISLIKPAYSLPFLIPYYRKKKSRYHQANHIQSLTHMETHCNSVAPEGHRIIAIGLPLWSPCSWALCESWVGIPASLRVLIT